jgi:hypothetical protein
MPVPSSVRNASYAVWAILVLMVLRTILTFVFKDDLVDAWAEDNASGLPSEVVADGAPNYAAVALVSLVLAAVLALAALNLPKGAKWARVVAIVFAVLSILGVAAAFVAPSLLVLQLVNIIAALLSLAVIILLVTGESNRFFAGASEPAAS